VALVSDAVVEVLTPVIGRPAAVICVSSSAIQLGKSSGDISVADLPLLAEVMRHSIRDLVSGEVLEKAISDVRALQPA
jgi:hypothetical protein